MPSTSHLKRNRLKHPEPEADESGFGPERITVTLIARVARELSRLRSMTGLSKTDLVNRSVSLYFLTQTELEKGNELAFFNPDTKEYQRVHIA